MKIQYIKSFLSGKYFSQKDLLLLTTDITNLVENHSYFHNIQYRYDDFDTRISKYKEFEKS